MSELASREDVLDTRSLLRGNLPSILAEPRGDGEIWLLGMNEETKTVIPGIGAVVMPLNLGEFGFPDKEMFMSKFHEAEQFKRSVSFFYNVMTQKWLCIITPIYIEGSLRYFILYTIEIAPKAQCMIKSAMDSFVMDRVSTNLQAVDSFLEANSSDG